MVFAAEIFYNTIFDGGTAMRFTVVIFAEILGNYFWWQCMKIIYQNMEINKQCFVVFIT